MSYPTFSGDTDTCASRPIDVRQAAKPDSLLADLRARLSVLEDGILRIQSLAEGADDAGRRRYAHLAAAGAREVDALRRRIDRLERELEAKAAVDGLVAGGKSLAELLETLETFVRAHDSRAEREAEIADARAALLASGHREDDDPEDHGVRAKLRASAPKPQRRDGVAPRPALVTALPCLTKAEHAEAVANMPEVRARARAAVAAAGGVGGPQIRVAGAVERPGAHGDVA